MAQQKTSQAVALTPLQPSSYPAVGHNKHTEAPVPLSSPTLTPAVSLVTCQ